LNEKYHIEPISEEQFQIYPIFRIKELKKFNQLLEQILLVDATLKENIGTIVLSICTILYDMIDTGTTDEDLEMFKDIEEFYKQIERLDLRESEENKQFEGYFTSAI
jgi:hypothetical protein